MWDVKTHVKPILLNQLAGSLEVYTTGTVKLQCPNLEGDQIVVSLLETCYLPQATFNLPGLQKLTKSLYVIEQEDQLGTQWVRNTESHFYMSMKEGSEGRAVVDCQTILPAVVSSVEVLGGSQEVEEGSQEGHVAERLLAEM